MSAEILPLLTALSPLIGVATTLAVKRWNSALVRPMALSNSAMTLLLACAAVWVQSDLELSGRTRHRQAEPTIGWLAENNANQRSETNLEPGIQIRLSLGLDGLSAWSALVLSLVVWGAICSSGRLHGLPLSSNCLWLMSGQALLLASCFATDAIVGIVCLEAALIPFYLLIGSGSEGGRRTMASAYWIWQMVGCCSTLLGVTMLGVAQPWMQADLVPSRGPALFETSLLADSLRQLLARSETAWHLWSHLAPWAAALMLLGLLIRLPVFPFLGWYHAALVAAPPGVAAVISVSFPLAALNAWLRLGLPLFAVNSSAVTGILSVASLAGALISGWALQSLFDLKRILATYSCAMLCMAGISLSLQNPDGIMGAWLLVISQGLAVAAGMLLVQGLEMKCGTRDLTQLPDLIKGFPRLRAALVVLVTTVPIASGFAAVSLQVSASTGASWWLIAGVSCAIVAIAATAVRTLALVMTPSAQPTMTATADERTDIGIRELFPMVTVLTLVLMLNIMPILAISTCEATIRRLFHRTESQTADLPQESTGRR